MLLVPPESSAKLRAQTVKVTRGVRAVAVVVAASSRRAWAQLRRARGRPEAAEPASRVHVASQLRSLVTRTGRAETDDERAFRLTGTATGVLWALVIVLHLFGVWGAPAGPRPHSPTAPRAELAERSPEVAEAESRTELARKARDAAAAVLVEFSLASYRHGASAAMVLPADTRSAMQAQRSTNLRTPAEVALRRNLERAQTELEVAEEEERAAVRAYLEALEDARRRAEAEQRRQQARPASSPTSRCAGDFACFKECTLRIESGGNYSAVDPSGTYRGAWQFDQRTWNGAVSRAGYEEWSGVSPDQAPPDIQDAAAAQLYSERGNQPWGGRC